MNEAGIIVIVVLLAMFYSVFNILTVSIVLIDRKLRHRPSNYPIISFLVGSAVQGLLPAPLYVYKILKYESESTVPEWMCDGYRFPYIFCGHIMVFSILIISIDRLCAVKYPFCYGKRVTGFNMILLLTFGWIITIGVDLVPFFYHNNKHNGACTYIPSRLWGLVVIIFYVLWPFLVVIINYSIIWRISQSFAVEERTRTESLLSNDSHRLNVEHQSELIQNCCNHKELHHKSKAIGKLKFILELKATKKSLAIVGVYFLCWIPMGVFFLADHFCRNCISNNNSFIDARRAVKILAFTSSLLSPMIYCWWNTEFRHAAKSIIKRRLQSEQIQLSPLPLAKRNTLLHLSKSSVMTDDSHCIHHI